MPALIWGRWFRCLAKTKQFLRSHNTASVAHSIEMVCCLKTVSRNYTNKITGSSSKITSKLMPSSSNYRTSKCIRITSLNQFENSNSQKRTILLPRLILGISREALVSRIATLCLAEGTWQEPITMEQLVASVCLDQVHFSKSYASFSIKYITLIISIVATT